MSRSRNNHGRGGQKCSRAKGFTLLELMFTVAIAVVISMLAMSQFSDYAERSRVATAKADISVISIDIQRYRNDHGALPASLADVGRGGYLDPWKNPYHYANVTGPGGKGKARKDKKFNPLNSDFDLFSAGKDGVFHNQVSHKDSLDDVIRARDGSFIDLAENF